MGTAARVRGAGWRRGRAAVRLRASGAACAGALLAALWTTGGPPVPDTLPPDAPVADAARDGDVEAVRALLRDGADVNAAHGDGMTALHWAAAGDLPEMAELLVYAGAHLGATTRIGGHTPLHVAARVGSAPVVATLVRAGADPGARTSTGVTPLHFAAGSGSAEAVQLLVDAGAEVEAREDAHGQTPLVFAAARGRVAALRRLLSAGADPAAETDVVDFVVRSELDDADRKRRNTLLAARTAADEEARAARASTSDPTAELRGKDGAAEAEEPAEAEDEGTGGEGVTGAPEAGGEASGNASMGEEADSSAAGAYPTEADPEAGSDGAGETAEPEPEPLSYADLVGRQGGMTALHYAAREGHVDVVRALLDAGADVNHRRGGDGATPLLVASINGRYDLAMELLALGADPNLASDAGAAPLFATLNNRWAPKALYPQPTAFKQQRTGYLQLLEALLEAGADPNARLERHLWYTSYNFDLLGVDFAGATPFWRAAYATDVAAMRLLVAYGADPDVPTTKPAQRRRRSDDGEDDEDPSGLPPVPVGGPAVLPIHAASGVGYGQEYAANAHRHVPNGWLPAVRYLVEELGADVNARDHQGYSPVHHAAARGDDELILYLVERGADVTFVSRAGQTTVDMANGPQQRVQPYPETIALLESLGAKNNHNCVSC